MAKMDKGIRPGEPDKTGNLPDDPTPARAEKASAPPSDVKAREASRHKTEAQVDEALDETFPASDPPAHATPVRSGPHRPAGR